jgi:hypothetical protein
MEFVGSYREVIGAVLLVVGAVLAAAALAWLLVAGYRAARARGPLALVAGGALVALTPFAVHALDGRAADLGPATRVLARELCLGVAEPGGPESAVLRLPVQAAVALLGAALILLAALWLLARGLRSWRRARWPVALLLLAGVFVAAPFALNALALRYVDLGPRERVVDGAVHLTLTGWDQKDYSVLRARPQTAVLQMANPDVTDDTLEYLRGMTMLRELDVSDSAVTDRGLAALRGLPLESLRLARTRVTDAGLTEHLAPLESLTKLDVSGTEVTAGAVDAWKKARPGRRALR